MNKQGKLVNGRVVGGIEWVKTVLGDGVEIQGYTSNPIGGCPHKCRWEMPDGTVAECYAETVAENVASAAYPDGFEAHYWNPEELYKWHSIKDHKRIFMGSMTDWMSLNVSDDEIDTVIHHMRVACQHTYITLTKNAPRLLHFPYMASIDNLWVGVSAPPSFMFGKRLSHDQQVRMVNRQIALFATTLTLSFDVSSLRKADMIFRSWKRFVMNGNMHIEIGVKSLICAEQTSTGVQFRNLHKHKKGRKSPFLHTTLMVRGNNLAQKGTRHYR